MIRTPLRSLALILTTCGSASLSHAEPAAPVAMPFRATAPAGWETMPVPAANPNLPTLAFATPEALHDGLRAVVAINSQPSPAKTDAARAVIVDNTMQMVREHMSKPPLDGKFDAPQDATLAGRPGKVVSYVIRVNGQPQRMKQWYVLVGDRLMSATYTANATIFEAHLAEAEAAVASVTLADAPASQPSR